MEPIMPASYTYPCAYSLTPRKLVVRTLAITFLVMGLLIGSLPSESFGIEMTMQNHLPVSVD
jgi:hypothetical protein